MTDDGPGSAGRARARALLRDLGRRELNFDPRNQGDVTTDNGWHIDDYRQALPSEPPGPPVPGGSWEIARRLVRDYEFADPAIIRKVRQSDGPLEQRDILMEARFYGLRFSLGVRVGDVCDDTVTVDGRGVRVWGWNYRTLEGHLEMGEMTHEVRKWLDTGEVEFHLHAYSRAAPMSNPVVRLGFRLFGRMTQRRFHRRACRRMVRFTNAELAAARRTHMEGAGRDHPL